MEASLNSPLGRTNLTNTVLTIGRTSDNQLALQDQQASSRHAEIRPDMQGYQLVDLGSRNGTFVNDERLAPQVPRLLNSGDVIRIGETKLTYEMAGSYDATLRANAADYASPGYSPTVAAQPPSGQQGYPSAPQQDYANYQQQQPFSAPNYPPAYPQQQPGYQGFQPPSSPNYPPADQPAYPQQPGYQPPQQDYPQQQNYPTPQQGYPQQPGFQQPPQQGYPQQLPWAGAPGQVGAPGTAVAAPKKSRTGLAIGIIVLLLIVVGGGIGGYLYINRSTPEKTLAAYCTDLQNGDAQGIFNLESHNAQQHTTLNELKVGLSGITALGGIKSCTVGPVTNNNGHTANGTLTITLGNGKPQTSSGVLVNENGTWKLGDTQANP